MKNILTLGTIAALLVVTGCSGKVAGPVAPTPDLSNSGPFVLQGTVAAVDESEHPLDAVTVTATNGSLTRTASTDADGRYLLDGLVGGTWSISAVKAGYNRGVQTVRLTDNSQIDFSLDIADPPERLRAGPLDRRQ